MSNPLIPNYVPGVGRLVTDRFDFQSHITGTGFRHTASMIDLSPLVTIDGYTMNTVQDAVNFFATAISPPIIAPATTSSSGIIKLSGDLGGVSSSVLVTGLQGKPVSTLSPITGYVLTWNGIAWQPSAATNAFTANGDLTGNNIVQEVIGISGLGGTVSLHCNNINFDYALSPSISQTPTGLGSGSNLNITAQGSTSNSGGNVIITGGSATSSGSNLGGGVLIKLAGTLGVATPIQAVEVAPGQRVLSLMHPGTLTTVDMPSSTGDLVMYVRNAATAPSSGIPTNGAVVYASGGQLWVLQADGNNFAVGSIPNPSIWGPTGQQTYSYRNYVTTTSSTAATAFTYAMPDTTAVKIDVIMVGKEVGTSDSAQFNLSMGYTRQGGAPVTVGSVTIADPRFTTAALSWTLPSITTYGNNLLVKTGSFASTTINWMVVVQLTSSVST